ncbi:uncharacterized protein EAE97_006609 [Botrytis byssoidea]|uniref:Uncharacterized protein n=1 Tax=Botrytis byssoidea TaxID=139641 RepID=A0A9P5ILW1_9HELO|nr:uncharacterized protein EAE97_006609 [Botrytis byssoidea]KAF7941772.1 hypothetical protein EAE97_006609 [Botrytis byssoidea]
MLHCMVDYGATPKSELNTKRFYQETVPEQISNVSTIKGIAFRTVVFKHLGRKHLSRSDCMYSSRSGLWRPYREIVSSKSWSRGGGSPGGPPGPRFQITNHFVAHTVPPLDRLDSIPTSLCSRIRQNPTKQRTGQELRLMECHQE